jgi:ATP-dependent DNA ligase
VSIDTDFDGEKCFPRIEAARRTVSGQEAVTEGELIAISNALQGTGYAYLADKLRNAAPIPATEPK